MEAQVKAAIESLANKAKESKSHEALHFSQAALNLAHVLQVIKQTDLTK